MTSLRRMRMRRRRRSVEMNKVDSPIHDDWEIVTCHLLLLLVRSHRQLHDHHCLEIDVDDEDDDVGHRDDNIGWDGNVGRKDEVPQCYEYLKHYNQHQLELMLSFPKSKGFLIFLLQVSKLCWRKTKKNGCPAKKHKCQTNLWKIVASAGF